MLRADLFFPPVEEHAAEDPLLSYAVYFAIVQPLVDELSCLEEGEEFAIFII